MAKRARKGLLPEDITVGMAVVYPGGNHGVVSDVFAPLNQFWVRDRTSGEVVRDDNGDIVAYGAEELTIDDEAPGQERGQAGSARVLLVGTEQQMLQIIQHFGAPDVSERREPQMLVAVRCNSCCCGPSCIRYDAASQNTCDGESCPLLQLACQGVEPGMYDLAQSLRPDLKDQISIRAYHLKQAVEQIGPDLLKLQDFYCLSAVNLPYGFQDIEAAGVLDRREMEDVRCQIDLDVTAQGKAIKGEDDLEMTARRVLGEACGISLFDRIWEDEVQFKMRKALGVDLPIKYWDGPDTKGFVLLLPSDLVASSQGGLLVFSEPESANGDVAEGNGGGVKAEPKLPEGWVRMKSRSNNQVYYWNAKTQTSTFEFPLPKGWTKQKSKTTGKVYYFNSKKGQSSYEIPAE